MTRTIAIVISYFLLTINYYSQTKVSNASGSWTTAAIWTPAGVPTSTDDVLVSNGNTVTIDANITVNKLTIGSGGGAAQLQYNGNTARTVSVTSVLTINSSATFSILTNSNATHSLVLLGDLVNLGTFRMYEDNNSLCNVVFTGNNNQNVSGTGVLTRFNRIHVNKGTSNANVLDISSSSFTVINNFLTLTNGTFKVSTPNAATLVPFTAATTIQATAGIWLNSSSASMSFSNSIGLNGLLTITNGVINVGNASNEDLTAGSGTLSINNGTLNISGKYNASASATTFSLAGGLIKISNNGSTNTAIAPFHISAAGSSFNMTGGTILLLREGGTGAQDLGFLNSGSTSGIVTGGTLQIGGTGSPANQIISINSTYTVPNLVVNSASVTAKLLTNSINILKDIVISTGTLNANGLGISLGGNWINTSTFVPSTGTVTFNSNSAQSITKTGGETFNHLLFNGSGLKTFGSAITANANFSISAGSTVDVGASNFQLTVKGDFINSGTFNTNSGLVFFNGAVSQNIGGSSTTNFYDLTMNNTAGFVLTNNENLRGTLTLNNGVLNTNSKVFTMVSNAANTARIAQLAGTGDISGNVTVQRYMPGGSTGWAFVGSPISSASTFNDWDDNLFISCPTCPDGYVPNFTSIYSYNETAVGSYSSSNSYVPMSSINDAIVAGKGYWLYLGNGAVNTTAITLDMVGTVRKNNFTIPLNYSNSGVPSDDGWNLICNPYPSPISWASLKGLTANIDNAIYVYNADLNSGTGGTASYINGVSSPLIIAGGIGDEIPMYQGFYVHSTGATSLAAKETNKIASTQSFLKSNSVANNRPLLRFGLSGPYSFNDETVLYIEQGATNGFDQQYDAVKFISQNPYAPLISMIQGSNKFQVNGISPIVGSYSTQLKTTTGYSGTYTIQITENDNFPKGACISLYDKFTNTTTNLDQNAYVFNLSDTTTVSRFILTISLNPLPISTNVVQASCAQPTAGLIVAKGNNSGPWNYYWKLNGQPFKTSLNKNVADSIKNVIGGNYELQVNTVSYCDNNTSNYLMQDKIATKANFSCIDTLFLNQSDSIQFFNQSVQSVFDSWDFGDNTFSNEINPVKHYNNPGNYTVNLQTISNTSCADNYSKILVVESEPLSIFHKSKTRNEFKVKTIDINKFEIICLNCKGGILHAQLFDVTGTLIKDYSKLDGLNFDLELDLGNTAKGIYSLLIIGESESTNIKLLVN